MVARGGDDDQSADRRVPCPRGEAGRLGVDGRTVCRPRAAAAALGPQGCRAVLWHQGESDAGQARAGYPADRQISGKQYREFMEKLVAASRKEAKWDVPWFTAIATYHSRQDSADEEFRAAQRGLWKIGVTLAGPDTDVLGPEFRDGVHFNAKGLTEHGRLWAETVAPYIDAQTRDPKAREAQR